MKTNAVRWLRISYWTGAIVDFFAGLIMIFPGLFAFMNRPETFHPAKDYLYAMGVGAPLMFGWTFLLLWADQRPLERRDILLITLLVLVGEVLTQVWGISVGFISVPAIALTFVIQAVLIVLFSFSYLGVRRMQ